MSCQLELFEPSQFLTELCIEGLGLDASSEELKPIARSLIALVRYHEQKRPCAPLQEPQHETNDVSG